MFTFDNINYIETSIINSIKNRIKSIENNNKTLIKDNNIKRNKDFIYRIFFERV